MSYKNIKLTIEDNIAYIGFGLNNKKSMTTLGQDTLLELKAVIGELEQRAKAQEIKGAIFHSLQENCFLAGVDINLISSMQTEADAATGAEMGQLMFNDLEDLPIPTIACVHGVCLGGGLELSLACKKIIVSDDAKTALGLPEVKLGLIPGFGGTYRLPKKVGLPKALELILSGKTLNGKQAKRAGLVEEYYAKERLLEMALKHLFMKKENKSLKESIEDLASDNFVARKIIFQKARESVLQKTKGFYQAPLKILEVMEAGQMKGRAGYLVTESQAFGELCMGEQSKNLQHIFFMSEGVKKYRGPKGSAELPQLKRGATLGAGTMGGGIAWLMAKNKMRPIMKDLTMEALELGLEQASKNFSGALKRKRMSYDDFERQQRSIFPQLDYHGFKRVDLIIEAVVENLDIKKKIFSELEKEVREDCLITSNTSSLRITDMVAALEIPARFAGLHFFNPVHKMPLVEIITHDKIAPETVEALHKWVLQTRKTPVIVKDGPGFLVNRILMPYLNEAAFLLEEGVSVQAIDDACLDFGMPMGPLRLMDEIGIDVGVKVAQILFEGLGDRMKPSAFTPKIVAQEFLGKKNGKGFYLYDEAGKVLEENAAVKEFLPKKVTKMNEATIQMRLFLPMINEAANILQDGIVATAADVDLGLIFGIGFPPFRGGLLRYADAEGLERIVKVIEKFAKEVDSNRYKLSDYLQDLVAGSKKFYDV